MLSFALFGAPATPLCTTPQFLLMPGLNMTTKLPAACLGYSVNVSFDETTSTLTLQMASSASASSVPPVPSASSQSSMSPMATITVVNAIGADVSLLYFAPGGSGGTPLSVSYHATSAPVAPIVASRLPAFKTGTVQVNGEQRNMLSFALFGAPATALCTTPQFLLMPGLDMTAKLPAACNNYVVNVTFDETTGTLTLQPARSASTPASLAAAVAAPAAPPRSGCSMIKLPQYDVYICDKQ